MLRDLPKICSSQPRKRFSRRFMLSSPLFPLPDGLEITEVRDTPEEVLVRVTSHRSSSPCPQCSTSSSAIHSSYRRHPKDLPCVGRPIRLSFTVRKFFCRNPTCSRKVFTERLPDFIEASSRLTKRLRTAVQEIGFATGGILPRRDRAPDDAPHAPCGRPSRREPHHSSRRARLHCIRGTAALSRFVRQAEE